MRKHAFFLCVIEECVKGDINKSRTVSGLKGGDSFLYTE